MSFQCLKCFHAWDFEDYQCPFCDSCTVDTQSPSKATLKYVFDKTTNPMTYDVVRVDNGVSIWGDEKK